VAAFGTLSVHEMSSLNISENSPAEPRLAVKAQAIIDDIRAAQSLDQRVIVSRQTAMQMLSVGQTRLLELEKRGTLHSLLDGASRRITTASIYSYLVARAVATHPSDGVEGKVRSPSAMKRRRGRPPRARTENELRALERANSRRHDEAEARRKADPATAE
jgi:hypothetical protein